MQLPKASLEHWMREFYFDAEFDLGSSGVYTFTFRELRNILNISLSDLDTVCFDDSLTKGSDGLRQAIANRWGDGNPNSVMTANGSNEMLYHILSTMLKKDDEVVILDTIYHALSAVPESVGCNIKYWSMPSEKDFRVDLNELKKLMTPNTKMVAVNFPHNPTGVTISEEEQKEIIKIVAEVDAYLVWDAAFDELTTQKQLENPFLLYEKAISVGTLSKCYGLPGLRIGWCFAPQEIIDACVQLRDYTTLYISPLIEQIGQKVIENADLLVESRMPEVIENKRILENWIADNSEYLSWSKPMAGVTCLIKFKDVDDVEGFCRDLVNQYSVMLVPGSCFGHDKYVRLGFGESTEKFKKGLDLLSKFLLETGALK